MHQGGQLLSYFMPQYLHEPSRAEGLNQGPVLLPLSSRHAAMSVDVSGCRTEGTGCHWPLVSRVLGCC